MMMYDESSVRCGLYVAMYGATAPKKAESKGGNEKGAKKQKGDKDSKKEQQKQQQPKQAATTTTASSNLSAEEIERRFKLIHSVGEECVTESDLQNLLSKKESFRLYDGFEPSGRMHIAQGIFKALNVNKCTSAGGTFVFWVADWFALMNDKMGGDLDKIKVVGQYFIEVWKGAGMDLKNVEFRWASDDIINNAKDYWAQMLDIAKRFSLARVKKCCQIMGRLENNLTAAQILYPLMQCCDVFFLKADICQLGVDQRKVNMLAREYCDSIGRKLKPVILSHHMLYGLAEGQAKMSKSNPDSAIFMEDPVEEVERKMSIAYCPRTAAAPSTTESTEESLSLVQDDLKNPCLDYVQHIVMTQPGAVFKAGGKTFDKFEQVRDAFLSGELEEQALKKGLADCINVLMQPVRDHFENNANAKQVLELVRQYKRESVQPPKRLKRMTKLTTPGKLVVVFAPIPTDPSITLGQVLSLRNALRKAKSGHPGKEVVLYMPELNAVALSAFAADKKLKSQDGVRAYYEVLLAALKTFISLEEENIKVIWQEETMLADPSDYWVSVINVGRRFQLQDVTDACSAGSDAEVSQAGNVVAALMHVGDVLALAPHALVPTCELSQGLHNLAKRYIGECADQEDAFTPPIVDAPVTVNTITSAVDAPNVTELLVFDNFKQDVKKKIKQAFCEPGNTTYNPVLSLFDLLAFQSQAPTSSCSIKTSNGDKSYGAITEVEQDYGTEAIHPGDLKAALNPIVEKTYQSLDKALKQVDKSLRVVQNYIKKTQKKK